jgi:hypothetical protein
MVPARATSLVATIAIAAAALAGCGGRCAKVADARAAAMARPPAAAGPHLRVRLPFALVNAVVADALAAVAPVPVTLAELGPLADAVLGVTAAPRALRLAPAGADRVRVELTIELRDRDGVLLALTAAGELAPEIERTDDRVAIAIGLAPAQLDRLAIELGADARATLGAALAARLPAAARARVPGFVLDAIAAAAVEELTSVTWAVLRRTLLPRLGELTRVRVALPPLPVAALALSSTSAGEPALELGVVTSLPVRAAVTAGDAPLRADAIELAASGSALAELASWAIAAGRAPARYDRSLHPEPDGDYVPRLDWRAGHPRPLVVHVDRVEDGCEWFTVGVTPFAALRGGQVIAGARTRTFERVIGPAYLHVAAWLKELLQRAVSRRAAAAIAVTVGDRRVDAALVDLVLDGAGVRATATLAVGSSSTRGRSSRSSRATRRCARTCSSPNGGSSRCRRARRSSRRSGAAARGRLGWRGSSPATWWPSSRWR